jgi:hypothetical protein
MEMKGIFWGLFEYLTDHDLRPHARNGSIQLEIKGHTVDLIPACRDRESSGNVLFSKRAGAAVHTDLAQHVHLVGNSGRQQEICAVKIWRERSGLEFPSLYLELTVLHALAAERFGQLADNVLTVRRYISNRFEAAVVRDPVSFDMLCRMTCRPGRRRLSPRRRATRCMTRIGRRYCGRDGGIAAGLRPADSRGRPSPHSSSRKIPS